jgi:hypothetical protein
MSPIGDIILTLSSYFHDAAAAFLVVGLAVVRILLKKYPVSGDAALEIVFVRVCISAARIVRYSFCWILVMGVPMAIFFKGRSSSGPGDLQTAAMAVKYAGMLFLAGIAFFSWSMLSKKVGFLKSKHTIND